MFWTKRVVIGDGERGLVYRNRQFQRVLAAGVYRWFDPLDRIEVRTFAIAAPEYAGHDVDALVARLGGRLGETFVLADIGVDEVGLVLKNGKLEDVLAPGSRRLYWRGLVEVEVRRVSLAETLELPREVLARLRQLGALAKVAVAVDVPAESAGLLFVDGRLVRTLAPGAWAFWNFRKNVAAEVIELRVQSVEVSGQELLTRDRVSLRVNLAATMRVTDPVAARTKVAKFGDQLYRELQYGLRKVVSARTLDELLGDKASLDADIFGYVRGKVTGFGIEVLGVGVKDVILPGEMKEILNSVVQAEKAAQANVIRRREEANATRSLLNTARLIEENPTLMRLKELEALEKVTEKIDRFTVFGGLDGVLNQLVTLK
ncbi:slipin family protein [Luteimonas sp. SJ-92]|uniref:Slipin family protein n=1 Tax=Luteimonas salinisoli TaxID=2752307 RepID=A0A853J775_9GAMM|nr:slipin family protein [Luteimonas salinisoli]NZA24966.1 slipin family protein [Luteimonas salinisoli]